MIVMITLLMSVSTMPCKVYFAMVSGLRFVFVAGAHRFCIKNSPAVHTVYTVVLESHVSRYVISDFSDV